MTRSAVAAAVQQKYIPFLGGLDTSSNRLKVNPGLALAAMNYEPRLTGGYRRVAGFERFDGQARPSDATFVGLTAVTTWSCAVGDALVGATSGATATVAYVKAGATWIAVTKLVGNFTLGETVNVSGSPVGVYNGDLEQLDGQTQNTVIAAAATVYRNLITAVPGSGNVRGVAEIGGDIYGWRDNAGGTACAIYKSTSAGWAAVPLYYELSFTAGSVQPAEGSTITQGAASATIMRVVLESGAWVGGTAVGRYIITAPTGGSFVASTALGPTTNGNTPAAGTGIYFGAQITLSPGGDYAFDAGTFVGGIKRLYGCDGVNREFEFDGSVLVPIVGAGGTNRASCVKVHAKQLWFSYKHAVQHSAIGFPYQWTALAGAAEIGVNSTITGLLTVGGSQTTTSLMIGSTAGVHLLYGTSDGNYTLTTLSLETGVDRGSMQPMEAGLSVSRNGIRLSSSTQHFDNFSYELASSLIEGYTATRVTTCSVLQRTRSMYRVFFDDGTGLCGVPLSGAIQWMPLDYGLTVRHTWSSEISGLERVFFTSDSGYVYEMDRGRSFDGNVIQAFLIEHPFTAGAPTMRKSFRAATLEATGESAFTLYLQPEFNYGDADELSTPQSSLSATGGSLRWDVSSWDKSNWDGGTTARMRFETHGGAVAMGTNFYTSSAVELPHTLHGLNVSYTTRRAQR